MINIYIVLLVVGIANIALGVVVATCSRRRLLGSMFMTLSIALGGWVGGIAGFGLSSNSDAATTFAKLFYIAPLYVACSFIYLAALFPEKKRLPAKIIFWPMAVATGFAALIALVPHSLIQSISLEEPRKISVYQTVYIPYAIVVSTMLGAALFMMMRKLKKLRGQRRTQARWFVVMGVVVSLIGGWYNIILAHWLGDYSYVWVGPLATTLYIFSNIFSIVRHGLFDIKRVTVRTLAYVLSLATLAVVYFGVAYVMSVTFLERSTSGTIMSPLNIILALILAFMFQPIRSFFDRVTDSIFYRDRYEVDTLIAEVGEIVTSTDDLHELQTRVAQKISDTIKASGCSFVVHREGQSSLQSGTRGHVFLTTHEIEELDAYVSTQGFGAVDITATENAKARIPAIISTLSRRRVALVLPLRTQSVSLGFLIVDDQKGAGYSARDISALETLTNELVIAIQNALSLGKLRDVNMNLEQRVSTATRQLRRSNSQLKSLDATKDEFISMASHQLRTPLTSIKGYLSMVLEGDVGSITPAQRELLEEAFNSSERMVHLIGDFLNVSRLQTGKFIIDRNPVDLAQIVAEEVESIRPLVLSHDIRLSFTQPKNIPIMKLDGEKTRQVIMNFIDNAVYYSRPKSTIVVKLLRSDGEVVLEVHDQGIGVPAEVQKRLFTKFFRADNARKQRPDGTGIGLFLAKKVITAQGGEIIFESREGKGSVFGFRLPIDKK